MTVSDIPAPLVEQAYQLLPALSPYEYDDLKKSIRDNGFFSQFAITVDENGRILDGHHRAQACADVGIECPRVTVQGWGEDQKAAFVLAANIARRHLSLEQKRNVVRMLARVQVRRSDASIAREVGLSDKTVRRIREDEQTEQTNGISEFPNSDSLDAFRRHEQKARDENHLTDAWFELVVHYKAPSDRLRRRGALVYPRENEWRTWQSGPLDLQTQPPRAAADITPFVTEIARQAGRHMINTPLRTMLRD